jgi:hypothetical protein
MPLRIRVEEEGCLELFGETAASMSSGVGGVGELFV